MKKLIIFVTFFIIFSGTAKGSDSNYDHLDFFKFGEWKISTYEKYQDDTNYKHIPKIMEEYNKEIIISRDKFLFEQSATISPKYIIKDIGSNNKVVGEKTKTSLSYNFLPKRKYRKVVQVYEKEDLRNEFEIIDEDTLVIIMYPYFFILKRIN